MSASWNEQQKILDRINEDRERLIEKTGWLAFFTGILLTSLIFVAVIIPVFVEPEYNMTIPEVHGGEGTREAEVCPRPNDN